ncbi:predicted protein [Histoplasma capsulatum var. duboisii H88]|uniref:Predicted protein n=1 Tax=Ajellomyces capsulatus (strain H88) TaxID=544711 RepID=F0URI2_AJEC8|nr:predicted protein [Histoplasma capsulatum var. duboisii H88]
MMQGSQLPPATIGEEVVELRVSRKRGSNLKPKSRYVEFQFANYRTRAVSFLISHILLKELYFRHGGMAISHLNPHCVLIRLSQNNQARFPQIQYFTGGPCDSCLGLYLHIADWACQGGGSGRLF